MTDTDTLELSYFFDPLCGWCYASAPALAGLVATYGSALKMKPSGLFMGPRPVSSIAAHAWRNDQRIGSLTGQRFTEAYRDRVLLAPDGVFDATALTLALVALGEVDPALEPRFLHAAQVSRYVEGEDTSRIEAVAAVVARVADAAGVQLDAVAFADRLRSDEALRDKTSTRVGQAQAEMRSLRLNGVPQLHVLATGLPTAIDGQDLYAGRDALLARIAGLSARS